MRRSSARPRGNDGACREVRRAAPAVEGLEPRVSLSGLSLTGGLAHGVGLAQGYGLIGAITTMRRSSASAQAAVSSAGVSGGCRWWSLASGHRAKRFESLATAGIEA